MCIVYVVPSMYSVSVCLARSAKDDTEAMLQQRQYIQTPGVLLLITSAQRLLCDDDSLKASFLVVIVELVVGSKDSTSGFHFFF